MILTTISYCIPKVWKGSFSVNLNYTKQNYCSKQTLFSAKKNFILTV